ncbi:MAG TPA: hypothetical protein DCY27_01970 [Desulfobacterales bacterium]|nr:hypothetical protein [Desulfobacterales bacterium]
MSLSLLLGGVLLLSSCTLLSNQSYTRQYPEYRGIKRVAVFVQRWPAYLQLPNQNEPGADFIKKSTLFTGPWQPAGLMNPRAVDVLDVDDNVAADLLLQVLTEKGYQPFLSGVLPSQPGPITVEEIMAKCEAVNRGVDAILFCFYSPTVFLAAAETTPKDHHRRSYSLHEIIQTLNPGGAYATWAGPRAAQAPPNSISHAFIFVSLTMFKVLDWRPLWEVADSQIGGRMRVKLAQCPPAPTNQNYPADAGIIQRLMCNNLTCRLRHLIPDAF